MILGTYSIVYASNGFKQTKTLISHADDYLAVIKPKYAQMSEYEYLKDYKKANAIKKEIFELYGDSWFTDQSPLFEAVTTGLIRLLNGEYKATVTLLK